MKPRKQKRYETPAQIKLAIIRLESKAKELEQSAEAMDKETAHYINEANRVTQENPDSNPKWLIEKADECRMKARRIRVRVNGIRGNRIAALGRTLAALQTEPMPFLNGDRSVQLEK